MSQDALFVYHDRALQYRFNDTHPFNQKRIVLTMDLLRQAKALDDTRITSHGMAAESELHLIHSSPYVDIVKALSAANPSPDTIRRAEQYGLDTEDTPFFEHMHEATSLLVGGSIAAADAVMTGTVPHAFHPGGGLHHAMPSKGSGFCVYNDASVAIAHIRRKYGARVLYLDTDVHHGDGVQWSFYSDPEVCTLSIHQTGKYLFPGTGAVNERGTDEGFGYSINVPLEPYTEDDSWLECFEEVLEGVVKFFKPDVIVSQHGCDAHAYDPLAHTHCSMRIYREMPLTIHRLAHEHCGGRWIALGGGGYDIWRVVPRAWSLLWLAMTDHPLIAELGRSPLLPLPAAWRETWAAESPVPLPETWLDPVDEWEPIPRRAKIEEKNRQTKEIAMLYLPRD
ncbi:acetoin utilization protein AcuC [Paenibacillus sp. HJGM_3]|uniref:acetoin utilization protein AcuC n=1 Tax=Paenibacillus sp. HJGM_3 TaxID=3379816 RepID=UPI00385A9EE6